MLHGRHDYDPIQDPREDGIPEDEPVMLFRAQDVLAPSVLETYAAMLRQRFDDPELVEQVLLHATRMRVWQEHNHRQEPDVPPHLYLVDEPALDEPPILSEVQGGTEQVQEPPENAPDILPSPVGGESEEEDDSAQQTDGPLSASAASVFGGQQPVEHGSGEDAEKENDV